MLTERAAALIITTCAKKYLNRKHGRSSLLSLWPAIDRLHSTYLDEKALRAGAEDCEWYTDEMMIAREKLKHDRDVVEALQLAWERISPPSERLTHEDYIVMSRKIYLALKADAEEGDFDPHDCLDDVEEDWLEDSGGKQFLGGGDFFKCWFQLADLNTSNVDAQEYAEFIYKLSNAICLPEGGYRDEQVPRQQYACADRGGVQPTDCSRSVWRAACGVWRVACGVLPAACYMPRAADRVPRGAGASPFIVPSIAPSTVPRASPRASQELLEELREAAELDDDEFFERRRIWFHDFDLEEPRGRPSAALQARSRHAEAAGRRAEACGGHAEWIRSGHGTDAKCTYCICPDRNTTTRRPPVPRGAHRCSLPCRAGSCE